MSSKMLRDITYPIRKFYVFIVAWKKYPSKLAFNVLEHFVVFIEWHQLTKCPIEML